MTIASTRAQAVAEILWELKRADKLATLSAVADRAGFPPGPKCRTISTCLNTVRRDWPHLQWWRAVADNGQLAEEQAEFLKEAGYGISPADDGMVAINAFEEQLMTWETAEATQE